MPQTEFEWQFSDDVRADEPPGIDAPFAVADQVESPPASIAPSARRGARRRLIAIGAIVALAVVVAGLLLASRADEAAAPIKKNVLDAYNVMHYAVEQGDADLFESLLSPASYPFAQAQRELSFGLGGLFDRGSLGLNAAGQSIVADVALSADMKTATVLTDQPYTTRTATGAAETIRLRQTTAFRFDGRRWLLAPMDSTFWGDTTIEPGGRWLTVEAPERDRDIARNLAGDLGALLDKACGDDSNLGCPERLHLRLRFTTEPLSLAEMLRNSWFGGGPPRSTSWLFQGTRDDEIAITLPTPTVVGLPLDGAGYQALLRSYATQLVHAVITVEMDSLPDRGTDYYYVYRTAEIDRQLTRLGLRPWPMPVVERGQIVPAPPNQDVALYCIDNPTQGGTLYRYNPATDAWSEELTERFFASMNALPSGSLILREMTVTQSSAWWRLVEWRDDGEQVVYVDRARNESAFFNGQTDPSGRRLLVELSGSNTFAYRLLDLGDCNANGCRLIDLPGQPVWSPDGSRTIMSQSDGNLLLGDTFGQLIGYAGRGRQPFWLDNQTYAYTSQDSQPRFALIETRIGGQATESVNEDDLRAALGTDADGDFYYAGAVGVNPADPSWLLIRGGMFSDRPSSTVNDVRDVYFLLNRQTGQVAVPFVARGRAATASYATFSADGRWIAATYYDPVESMWKVQLISLGSTPRYTFQMPSHAPSSSYLIVLAENWSDDGQWLHVLADGVLYLIAPEHDHQRAVVPDAPGCVMAAWIDRN
jgi:hypothetical protein